MVINVFFENPTVNQIMWKNILEPGRPETTIRCMKIACWIPKAKNTHSQYVILIAFPMQKWLNERASTLRYTYIACLVFTDVELVRVQTKSSVLQNSK